MMVSKAQTRANYDRLSRWYDILAGSSERAQREVGLCALDVRPGERVLEIGAGTGAALLTLAGLVGPDGVACGLDLSPGMCRVARQRFQAVQCPAVVATILCGDAASQPFMGGAFDAIFMSFTLELFDTADMERVLSECRRVLRAEGRLGVVALSDLGWANWMRRMYDRAHRRFPAWIDCRPIALTDILADQGFHIRSVTRGSVWGLSVELALAGKNWPAP